MCIGTTFNCIYCHRTMGSYESKCPLFPYCTDIIIKDLPPEVCNNEKCQRAKQQPFLADHLQPKSSHGYEDDTSTRENLSPYSSSPVPQESALSLPSYVHSLAKPKANTAPPLMGPNIGMAAYSSQEYNNENKLVIDEDIERIRKGLFYKAVLAPNSDQRELPPARNLRRETRRIPETRLGLKLKTTATTITTTTIRTLVNDNSTTANARTSSFSTPRQPHYTSSPISDNLTTPSTQPPAPATPQAPRIHRHLRNLSWEEMTGNERSLLFRELVERSGRSGDGEGSEESEEGWSVQANVGENC